MGVIYLNGIPYAGGGSGGGGGTGGDYATLSGKPTLNGIILAEGQTLSDLKLTDNETIFVDPNNKLSVNLTDDSDINSLFE